MNNLHPMRRKCFLPALKWKKLRAHAKPCKYLFLYLVSMEFRSHVYYASRLRFKSLDFWFLQTSVACRGESCCCTFISNLEISFFLFSRSRVVICLSITSYASIFLPFGAAPPICDGPLSNIRKERGKIRSVKMETLSGNADRFRTSFPCLSLLITCCEPKRKLISWWETRCHRNC